MLQFPQLNTSLTHSFSSQLFLAVRRRVRAPKGKVEEEIKARDRILEVEEEMGKREIIQTMMAMAATTTTKITMTATGRCTNSLQKRLIFSGNGTQATNGTIWTWVKTRPPVPCRTQDLMISDWANALQAKNDTIGLSLFVLYGWPLSGRRWREGGGLECRIV